jgi:hypothetical protein
MDDVSFVELDLGGGLGFSLLPLMDNRVVDDVRMTPADESSKELFELLPPPPRTCFLGGTGGGVGIFILLTVIGGSGGGGGGGGGACCARKDLTPSSNSSLSLPLSLLSSAGNLEPFCFFAGGILLLASINLCRFANIEAAALLSRLP